MIKYHPIVFGNKISYINEIANLCEKTKIDIKDISSGMGLDQRIGDRFLSGPIMVDLAFRKILEHYSIPLKNTK